MEKAKLKWPRKNPTETITLTSEQWSWLLRGFDINQLKPHKHLKYRGAGYFHLSNPLLIVNIFISMTF
jgi:transposase